jgi:hypothetical protein
MSTTVTAVWTLRLRVVYITGAIVRLFSELLSLFTAKQLVCYVFNDAVTT